MGRRPNNYIEQEQTQEKPEQSLSLIVVNTIRCDGIVYASGDSFPIDHSEAERLFNLGVLVEK